MEPVAPSKKKTRNNRFRYFKRGRDLLSIIHSLIGVIIIGVLLHVGYNYDASAAKCAAANAVGVCVVKKQN